MAIFTNVRLLVICHRYTMIVITLRNSRPILYFGRTF